MENPNDLQMDQDQASDQCSDGMSSELYDESDVEMDEPNVKSNNATIKKSQQEPDITETAMNPRTDVILAIRPEFMATIISGEKNHDFRKYKLPDNIHRIWFFQISPVKAITHIALTGLAKVPGQVHDSSGIGNDEFDLGLKKSNYGYPIFHLYQLMIPIQQDAIFRYSNWQAQGPLYISASDIDINKIHKLQKLF
jgi:hypothetical protein